MHENIKCFVAPPKLPPFWVWMSGISYCDGTYLMDRPCEYIMEGTGTLELDGQSFTPSAGDMYILPLGSHQHYASSGTNPWKKIFFNLQGDAIPLFLKAYHLEGKILFTKCEEFYPIFKEFYECTLKPLPVEEIMEKCCMLLHQLLMRLSFRLQNSPAYSDEACTLRNYIDRNIDKDLSITDLADSIYRSNDYVIKLFKNSFGQTPHSYLIDKKMEIAKMLLSNTQLNIQQISERLGYRDSHYFSKCFKSMIGTSPSDYRKTF